jgi:hypothetical protein
MTDIKSIENEADKYNYLKDSLREFYRGNIESTELMLMVYFLENRDSSTKWTEVSKKMPSISRSTYFRALKTLKDGGKISEDKYPKAFVTYLISDGILYKIGISSDLNKRLSTIKSSNPRAEVIDFLVGDYESYLHSLYEDNRESGEWFNFSKLEIKGVLKLFEKIKKDTAEGNGDFDEKGGRIIKVGHTVSVGTEHFVDEFISEYQVVEIKKNTFVLENKQKGSKKIEVNKDSVEFCSE